MRNLKPLSNTVFIIGLLVLLLNDQWWKAAFHNDWTGKISDFAGMLIFPMFLVAVTRMRTLTAILLTAIGFIYWKSPFSQPLIDGINSLGGLQFARVVDYTDLWAFLVFPLTFIALEKPMHFNIESIHTRRLAQFIILPLSLFAFIATSVPDEDYDPLLESSLTRCCDIGPIDVMVGNARVYVPTAFTPDGDGLNDVFQVMGNAELQAVDSFVIYELVTYDTIFFVEHMTDMSLANGFDGIVNDTVRAARYDYRFVAVASDSSRARLRGYVCSIPCMDPIDEARPEALEECLFSTQQGVDGGLDSGLPSGEMFDCFE